MLSWFLFAISTLVILLLVWYIKELLSRFKYLSDNSSRLLDVINSYRDHLGSVYELPMFYGDETLKGLLNHTRDVSQDLDILKEMFFIEEEAEGEIIDEETEGEITDEETEG